MKIKRALICDGGGMQGSFMAGILDEFYQRGARPSFFDLYVGTSAGAYCAAYFLTGQLKEGLRIWEKHLPNGFITKKNLHPYYDLGYLEKIITKIEPLNIATLQKTKQKLIVVLTDPLNCKAKYININQSKNPIKTLLAAVSAPVISKEILIEGKIYYDGGFTAQPPISYPDLKKIHKMSSC